MTNEKLEEAKRLQSDITAMKFGVKYAEDSKQPEKKEHLSHCLTKLTKDQFTVVQTLIESMMRSNLEKLEKQYAAL